MNKNELLEVLASLDMHPSRKLGQNFLLDPNMLSAIVSDADVKPGERILEVGPGLGMLTGALLQAGAELTAVELDHRLAGYLRNHFAGNEHFHLIEGDACKVDFDEIMGETPYRCVANLPYSCSTPFLANISSSKNPPRDLTVLLQREMADRLVAAPGSKEYGAPTVKVGLLYSVRILRNVDRKVFFPVPEVTSALVQFKKKENQTDPALRKLFEELVNVTFQQRRKKAVSQVAAKWKNINAPAVFASAGLPDGIRADAISRDAFLALARELQKQLMKINS